MALPISRRSPSSTAPSSATSSSRASRELDAIHHRQVTGPSPPKSHLNGPAAQHGIRGTHDPNALRCPIACVAADLHSIGMSRNWARNVNQWQIQPECDTLLAERCSELDLLGCDPSSGYAALRFNMQETEMAYGSLRLRDGVRAAPSRNRLLSIAPPLCAPARVIPCRTLLDFKVHR
jgi:hypothetical protein